jgi:hypothetical protein
MKEKSRERGYKLGFRMCSEYHSMVSRSMYSAIIYICWGGYHMLTAICGANSVQWGETLSSRLDVVLSLASGFPCMSVSLRSL